MESGSVADDPAEQDLVQSNLGFVAKIASAYRYLGLPFEDLLNEGNIGLIEAARRFDPNRGAKFITYATWWVRKSILKAVSQHAVMVRVPEYRLRQARTIRNVERSLSRELGREADREEISRALRLTKAKIDELRQIKMTDLSLNDKVAHEWDATLLDRLADERSVDPEGEMIRRETQQLLRLALRKLSDLQLRIIVGRFGLTGEPACTLKEIGDRLGMSRERVRQVEHLARNKLRKAITRGQRMGPARRAISRPPGAMPLYRAREYRRQRLERLDQSVVRVSVLTPVARAPVNGPT